MTGRHWAQKIVQVHSHSYRQHVVAIHLVSVTVSSFHTNVSYPDRNHNKCARNKQAKTDTALRVPLLWTNLPIESRLAFSVRAQTNFTKRSHTLHAQLRPLYIYIFAPSEETINTLKEGAKREYDFYEVSGSMITGQVWHWRGDRHSSK